MSFGKRLKELRKEADLTQTDLSIQTGISKSSISMYENNNRTPELETFESLADFFNVDMDYLKCKSGIKRKADIQNIALGAPGEAKGYQGYYLDEETAKLAQEIYDNPDLRILLDASRKATPEDLKTVAKMVAGMVKEEQGDDDY